jgi:hypothetical protein
MKSIGELADKYLEEYRVVTPKSATFAEYAIGHLKRLLGGKATPDITVDAVKGYRVTRLREKASPKSINEETGFLLRVLDKQGDFLRRQLRRKKR